MFTRIRGRLGRPMASIVCGLMLMSFLLPLVSPPVQAQALGKDVFDFFETELTTPTPIVVLDFVNESRYATGMLGRTFADAMSIELVNTRTFEVVKRSAVQQVLDDAGLNIPLSWDAQSMIADRLKAPFVLSGEIQEARVVQAKEGTYAEVVVNMVVVSKVTRFAINGARVLQKSSPKIGFTGNPDVLVHEALNTAAYQAAQRLLENRLPIATVLHSPRTGEVLLRGGSTIGLRNGMEMVTIRRNTITGRLRLINVSPSDSTAAVMEEKQGIAAGDKAIPVFELQQTSTFSAKARERTGLQIAGIALLAGLGVLIGTDGGSEDLQSSNLAVQAAAMSDAYSDPIYAYGANVIKWQGGGNRALAYLIYRDDGGTIPIAAVQAPLTSFIDDATPLYPNHAGYEMTMEIEIDDKTGQKLLISGDEPAPIDSGTTVTAPITLSDSNLSVTCVRELPVPGSTHRYRIQTVYVRVKTPDIDDELGLPEQYELALSDQSSPTAPVTLLPPPELLTPNDGDSMPKDMLPRDYPFTATRSQFIDPMNDIARDYVLQVSRFSDFRADDQGQRTLIVQPCQLGSIGEANVSAVLTTDQLATIKSWWLPYINDTDDKITIYWRVGVKVSGQSPMAYFDTGNDNGYVFSVYRTLSIFKIPPPPGSLLTRTGAGAQPGVPGKLVPKMPGRSRLLGRGH